MSGTCQRLLAPSSPLLTSMWTITPYQTTVAVSGQLVLSKRSRHLFGLVTHWSARAYRTGSYFQSYASFQSPPRDTALKTVRELSASESAIQQTFRPPELMELLSDRKRKILNGTEYIRRKTGYRGKIRRGRQAPAYPR